MSKRRRATIGPIAAAALLGISPELLRYRAVTGKIRVVRLNPTCRFRIADVLEARERMAVKDKRGSWLRPDHALTEIQGALR